MTILTSVLTWEMSQPVSLPIIIALVVVVLELHHPVLDAGGENVVPLPLSSASHKSAIKSGANVAAALILAISQLSVTSAATKF